MGTKGGVQALSLPHCAASLRTDVLPEGHIVAADELTQLSSRDGEALKALKALKEHAMKVSLVTGVTGALLLLVCTTLLLPTADAAFYQSTVHAVTHTSHQTVPAPSGVVHADGLSWWGAFALLLAAIGGASLALIEAAGLLPYFIALVVAVGIIIAVAGIIRFLRGGGLPH